MEERMRYFDYDGNEDFRDDVDNFFNEENYFEDEEDIMMQDYIESIGSFQPEDSKPKILETARKTLEKSWFWRFRSEDYKAKKIAELYTLLYVLLYKTEIKIEDKKEDSE